MQLETSALVNRESSFGMEQPCALFVLVACSIYLHTDMLNNGTIAALVYAKASNEILIHFICSHTLFI